MDWKLPFLKQEVEVEVGGPFSSKAEAIQVLLLTGTWIEKKINNVYV